MAYRAKTTTTRQRGFLEFPRIGYPVPEPLRTIFLYRF